MCVTMVSAPSAYAGGWYGAVEVATRHGVNVWDAPRILAPDPTSGYWVHDGNTGVAPRLVHVDATTGSTDRHVILPRGFAAVSFAADVDGTFLLLDSASAVVTRVDAAGAVIQTFGVNGSAPGQLQRPQAIAVASDGSYYVADVTNDTVVQFERDGSVRGSFGSVGTGDGQFRHVLGLAVAANGDVYTLDDSNRRVQRFSAAGAYIARWGSIGTAPGQFGGVKSISVDHSSGDVFVADSGNSRVQRFAANGTFLNLVADGSSAHPIRRPWSVLASGGAVRVVDIAANQVRVYASDGGYTDAEGDAFLEPGALRYPRDIAVGPDGSYVVTDYFAHRMQRFAADGTHLVSFGGYGTGSGQVDTPRGVAIAANGDVFVADSANARIVRYASDGTFIAAFGSAGAGPGQFATPVNLAVLPDGNLLVGDAGNGRIQRVQPDGTWLQSIGSTGSGPGQFSGLRGIAAAPDGGFYVSDSGNGRIQRFAADGSHVSSFGSVGSAPGQFATAYRIDVLRSGNLLVTDTDNERLQILTPDGAFVDSIAPTEDSLVPSFGQSNGAVEAPDGSLLVLDRVGHRVVRLRYDDTAPTVDAAMVAVPGGVRLTASASDAGAGVDAGAGISLDGGATWSGTLDTVITAPPWSVVERRVLVRDRVGNVADPVTVSARVADTAAPIITLPRGIRTTGPVAVRGTLTFASLDADSGIASVTASFRGRAVTVTNGSVTLAKAREGAGELRIHAMDFAGNVSELRVAIVLDRTAPRLGALASHVFGDRMTPRWSDNVSGIRTATRSVQNLRFGANIVTLRATDRHGNSVTIRHPVFRHLSLARPQLNRSNGTPVASMDRAAIRGSLRFVGYAAPWYAHTDDSPVVVSEVQERLRLFGYLRRTVQPGLLDIPTIRAIQAYQRARGLPVLGTVGPRTRAALDRDLLRSFR